jgi:hypothetical protein
LTAELFIKVVDSVAETVCDVNIALVLIDVVIIRTADTVAC